MFRVKPPTKILNNRPRRRLSVGKTSTNSGRSMAIVTVDETKTRGRVKLLTGYTTPPTRCSSHPITSKGLGHSIRNY